VDKNAFGGKEDFVPPGFPVARAGVSKRRRIFWRDRARQMDFLLAPPFPNPHKIFLEIVILHEVLMLPTKRMLLVGLKN
jgi:hypothetical protein